MELEYKIKKALQFIECLSGKERETLQRICFEIQAAEDVLNIKAVSYFQTCMYECRGICCKNINVNDILTQLDLVYITALKKERSAQMLELAKAEKLFTADCLFLKEGSGPCFFPANAKPERCIITFCGEIWPIRREIKAVRSKFSALSRFTKLKRPFLWIRF